MEIERKIKVKLTEEEERIIKEFSNVLKQFEDTYCEGECFFKTRDCPFESICNINVAADRLIPTIIGCIESELEK